MRAIETLYSVHPSVIMARNVVAAMKQKTGRSLEEWISFVNEHGPAREEDRRSWLKSEQGLGRNYAWWIAQRSVGKGEDDTDPEAYLCKAAEYVDAMYSGKRAHLRPVYDRLLSLSKSLGPDVRACPCQTMVPLFRTHVFAEIKPSTNSRVDLGLALRDLPAVQPLIDTGGSAKKDRITHRIPISGLEQINEDVQRWLRSAYDLNP